MAGKYLIGPLVTQPGPQGGLGSDKVSVPISVSVPDPLNIVPKGK